MADAKKPVDRWIDGLSFLVPQTWTFYVCLALGFALGMVGLLLEH